MNSRRKLAVIAFFSTVILLFSGIAAMAAGTIRVTLKYQDSYGVEQPLQSAYLYLQDGTTTPPLEKFFKSADYIFGPTNAQGLINVSVPPGTYYIRLTKRNPQSGNTSPLGPPEGGDYTWTDYQQITVTDNTVTDLGTKYAFFYNRPITITGVIKNSNTGQPWPGRYVRAQPEPCIEADYSSEDPAEWVDTNRCGPVQYMAQQKTDAQGRYTLLLREPGAYWIVTSQRLGDYHQQYAGNRLSTGWSTSGPITFTAGQNVVLDMNVPPAY